MGQVGGGRSRRRDRREAGQAEQAGGGAGGTGGGDGTHDGQGLDGHIAELREEDGPVTGGMEINRSTNGITEKGHLQKGIPKKGLTEIKLVVGGSDVKAAN